MICVEYHNVDTNVCFMISTLLCCLIYLCIPTNHLHFSAAITAVSFSLMESIHIYFVSLCDISFTHFHFEH